MQALILAGGSGTRFWPSSRKTRPKQLLALEGERSLLQATVDRLAPLVPPRPTCGSAPPPRCARRSGPVARGAGGADPLRADRAQHRAGDRLVAGPFPAREAARGGGGAAGRPPLRGRRGFPRHPRQGGRPGRRGQPGGHRGHPPALGREGLRLPREGRPARPRAFHRGALPRETGRGDRQGLSRRRPPFLERRHLPLPWRHPARPPRSLPAAPRPRPRGDRPAPRA